MFHHFVIMIFEISTSMDTRHDGFLTLTPLCTLLALAPDLRTKFVILSDMNLNFLIVPTLLVPALHVLSLTKFLWISHLSIHCGRMPSVTNSIREFR